MQMMFQRPTPIGPAARSQPLRGTFALEPIEALPRLSDRIRRLAERSLEPNPFFLPEFLEPAVEALGKKALRLALFSDRDDLHFFAPVVAGSGSMLARRSFSVWAHLYAPLGTPLIDRDTAPQVADSLLAHMRTSGRTLLSIPYLPIKSLTARALGGAVERSGYSTIAEVQMRPVLYPKTAGGLRAFDQMVNQKRRHDLDRQMRRLCEAGAVSFMWARTATEIESAFNMFVALEASGWKGRHGTALARRQRIHEFARIAVAQLAQSGQASIDVMRVGDKPIAALIRFDYRGLSIPWKIAFDENYAEFSPGKQLMCDETRRWLALATSERIDPVCEEDNPMMASLWPEREPYGTLLVSSSRLGLGARWRAGVTSLKATGKTNLKRLLKSRRRRIRRGGKTPKAASTQG